MKSLTYKLGKFLVTAALVVGIAGCKKDVFDKTDLNATDDSIWDTESAATLYLNGTYDLIMPNWPVPGSMYNTSDELNNANATILYGNLTGIGNEVTYVATSAKQGADQYFSIYRCNLAIKGINAGALPSDIKAKLKGQFFFLRAYVYFNLIKLYGGMPLVLTPQVPGIDNIQVPRSKTSDCIKQITADLDSCSALPAVWPLATDGGRITRDAALALKGKVLMYWASPQFNPNDDVSRWQDAYNACKTAYTQAVADGYALYPTFANIFTDETSSNKERMIWRTLDNVSVNPAHGTNNENITRPYSETTGGGGSNEPTWNLVKAFPMANGLPITDPNSGYNPELFWQNRDPRFYATIAYNGCTWNLSGKTNRLEWTYQGFLDDNKTPSVTGFYCRKICNPAISAAQALYNTNTGGGSGMDWIEMRFAEVLLNYAECANGIGQLDECKGLVAQLRARAGIAQGTNNYGLNAVTSRAQMFAFLLTEREVEFAMEGKRCDDLRRTRQFDKLTGTQRLGFQWKLNSPYVAGALPTKPDPTKKYIDVTDALGLRICDTINVNNKATYEKFFNTAFVVLEPATSPVINYPPTYYFYPLPQNFVQSGVAIQQNIGWPGGTFDPLQ